MQKCRQPRAWLGENLGFHTPRRSTTNLIEKVAATHELTRGGTGVTLCLLGASSGQFKMPNKMCYSRRSHKVGAACQHVLWERVGVTWQSACFMFFDLTCLSTVPPPLLAPHVPSSEHSHLYFFIFYFFLFVKENRK